MIESKLEKNIKILKERSKVLNTKKSIPTILDIKEIEKELGKQLPNDLKEFLLNTSDIYYGYIEQPLAAPKTSRNYLVSISKLGWEQGIPNEWLPFCYDNGDYFCFNENNEIVFYSHNGLSDEKWEDLASWIEDVWIDEAGNN